MSGKTKYNLIQLRELHAKGMHPSEAAAVIGCHQTVVIQQWHNLGLVWSRNIDGRKSLTAEQEKQAIAQYVSGVGATTVSKKFGVDKGTIYNLLKREGVGTRSVASRRTLHNHKFAEVSDRDREIVKLHESKLRVPEIAKRVDVSEATVRHSLKKQGFLQPDEKTLRVVVPPKPRNLGLGKGNRQMVLDAGLDHNAFARLTEHSMYWIGFLLADGCAYTGSAYGQHSLCVQLGRVDKVHLEKLKAWLGTNKAIVDGTHFSFGKVHEHSALSVRSTKIVSALAEYGVVNHKQGRFVSPVLMHSKDFWRGLVDGDGSVYHPDDGCAYLSGQPPIIAAWESYCASIIGAGKVRVEHRPAVSTGTIRFKADAATLLEHLYSGAAVYLDRKHATAKLWLRPPSEKPQA